MEDLDEELKQKYQFNEAENLYLDLDEKLNTVCQKIEKLDEFDVKKEISTELLNAIKYWLSKSANQSNQEVFIEEQKSFPQLQ